MKIIPFYSLLAVVFSASYLNAQSDVPAVASAQSGSVYLTHATIHDGRGKVWNDATIGFDNGKIILLEERPAFKTTETMGKVIDCTGKHIYPGIIAPNTVLGLTEIESVRATNDKTEVGKYNPDVRAAIAYNTDSRVTPTVRSNGVLYAQVVPQGSILSGTSAVVQLDAWNWEDALIKEDGIWMEWPAMVRNTGWWAEPGEVKANKEYDKEVIAIREYFKEAKAYAEAGKPEKKNLRFEAMRPLFSGKINLYITTATVGEITHAVLFAEEMGIRPVIAGGAESAQIAEFLAGKKVPVILGRTHSLPSGEDQDLDQAYKTPALLKKAGVSFCLSIPEGFWQERNLAFNAGTAVAYGLSKEEALSAITYDAARILGLDDKIGSLEKGKEASLIISTGDVLDMRSCNIEAAFISGRQIDLSNKQKTLYEKYAAKYRIK